MADPVQLPTAVTDAQRAADYRARIQANLEAVCEVFNEARAHNITIGFNIGLDAYGRSRVDQINISKIL